MTLLGESRIDRGSNEWIRHYEYAMKNYTIAATELGYTFVDAHKENEIEHRRFKKKVASEFADGRYVQDAGI